jgi:hypothetical protein
MCQISISIEISSGCTPGEEPILCVIFQDQLKLRAFATQDEELIMCYISISIEMTSCSTPAEEFILCVIFQFQLNFRVLPIQDE